MVEIAKNPEQYGLSTLGGKSVDHIAWHEQSRGPVATKEFMDIVTDDGSMYRWARLRAGEKWTFEHRVRPNGTRDSATRQLPAKVDALVDRSEDVLYC